jgi:formate dehydrogenase major subunit
VLPASVHFESGGSFSNTQKFIQQFEAAMPTPAAMNSFEQLRAIAGVLGMEMKYESPADVLLEAAGIIQRSPENGWVPYRFVSAQGNHPGRRFEHGCDNLVKYFDKEWEKAFNHKKDKR